MKTIVLIRHSEPIKDRTMPTALLPLSERGILRAQELFSLDIFRSVNAVYSSPYKRAFSTAEKLCRCFSTDYRLRERELGNPQTLDADFWEHQYENHDYKNSDGESLNDTRERMTLAVGEILSSMRDGETSAVVTHAAAICAFLLNECSIEVVNASEKIRKIVHNGNTVLNGKIAAPSAFILNFENDRLCSINYLSTEKELIADSF